MVNNVGANAQNPYGAINKVGMTQDGRVVYQVVNPEGKVQGGLSVAAADCDTFERSYKDIMEAAPKLEKYMQTHTEDDMKKAQKKGRWITAIGGFTGGIIPVILTKNYRTFVQIICTAAGVIAGLFAGAKVAQKVSVPPGAEQMTRASQEISKLDIQAVKI